MSAPRTVLGVGVLGAGTVGSQVIRILQSSREDFAARSGAEMEVRRVLVRNVDAPRDSPIDRELLTTDPAEAIDGMDLVDVYKRQSLNMKHAHFKRSQVVCVTA